MGKASLTVIKTNEHLHGLQMDLIDNGNITSNELNKGGLHLNPRGLGKLAINFIRGIKKFATTGRQLVTGSFHKASSFDSQINFRSFTNLGNTEKSDQSAINRVNETSSEETLKNDGLNEIRKKNPNRIIIAHLNINSIRNKFEMLKEVIGNLYRNRSKIKKNGLFQAPITLMLVLFKITQVMQVKILIFIDPNMKTLLL